MSTQRFVITARIVGYVHRISPKLKMFMISVLWSDEAEVMIYRSFKDFRKFHGELKKKFPHTNSLRKSDRMLPKFRGKARKSSMSQKGSKRSVQRMKFLESYCEKLLKSDQNVTQSTEVARFFTPKDHDLQPDYTRNSVMVLMSEDLPDGSGENGTRQHAGSVTHPFVTQTYRCVAPYETKDTKNRPFKVTMDEKLDVLIKDPTGWWLVESEDKRLAWFPAPYLDLWDEEDDDDDWGFQQGGALYCAVRSYSTKKADEVSVHIGSVVEVLRKSDNGWWLIRFNGKAGYIPSMYLQPYNNPRAGLYGLQKKLHSSTLNLAVSREAQPLYPPSISEENSPQSDVAGPSRPAPSVPPRLHKARSMDILSESWTQSQTSDSGSGSVPRRLSNTSTSFSDFSLTSDDSLGLQDEAQADSPTASPQPRDLSFSSSSSNISSERSESARAGGSPTASNAPRMPPRPKTEEILTRCTTMTRKAAIATKTRLQSQADTLHSR